MEVYYIILGGRLKRYRGPYTLEELTAMLELTIGLLVILITLLGYISWKKQTQWQEMGVKVPKFTPIIGHLFFKNIWLRNDKTYHEMKNEPYWGNYEFFQLNLYIKDTEMIRDVMIKHADHFLDRRHITFNKRDSLIAEMLSTLNGEKWKALRNILTPTFTTGKIKGMFPLVSEKVDLLVSTCGDKCEEQNFVEIKGEFEKFTMDVIATCAFGVDVNCLKNETSDFIKNAKPLVNMDYKTIFKFFFVSFFPRLSDFLGISIFGTKEIEFFKEVIDKVLKEREASGIRRGDFLDIISDAKNEHDRSEKTSKYPMTMNTIYAQSVLFILAGFDPTSNSLCFVIHCLAKNPAKQELLRQELRKSMEVDGELNYTNIMESRYMDACISEALRMYGPAHLLERYTTKDYKFSRTGLEIKAGTVISVPSWSLSRDPDLWESPLEYMPERFLSENKSRVQPYAYLPFGLGQRNCIGLRFALMVLKLAVAKVCLSYELSVPSGYETLILSTNPSTLRPSEEGVRIIMKNI